MIGGPIVVAGEALVDLVAGEEGHFAARLGGGPYNAARAIARLGRRTLFVGSVSTDPFGDALIHQLVADGVDTAATARVSVPSTLAVATVNELGAARYSFYTEATAAPQLAAEQLVAAAAASPEMVLVGTLGLVLEPFGTLVEEWVAGLPADTLLALDPNCRPGATADPPAYRARVARLAARAHVIKVSDEDLEFLSPGTPPVEAARQLVAAGCPLVLVTHGAAGIAIVTDHGLETVPAVPTTVVDTIGAGDAFIGGVLASLSRAGIGVDGLADADAIWEAVRFGALVASRTCARPGADPPTLAELDGRAS